MNSQFAKTLTGILVALTFAAVSASVAAGKGVAIVVGARVVVLDQVMAV